MMEHGARNFVFASRSGLSKQSAKDLVSLLESRGARVAVFNCNASMEDQVDGMVSECKKTLPPIRGVIQGAMVLRVCFTPSLS